MMKYTLSFFAFFSVTFLSASDVTSSTEGTRTETYRGNFIEIDEKGIVKFLPRKIPLSTSQTPVTTPFRPVGPYYVQDGMPFRYTERIESDDETLQKKEEAKKQALRDEGRLSAVDTGFYFSRLPTNRISK